MKLEKIIDYINFVFIVCGMILLGQRIGLSNALIAGISAAYIIYLYKKR